MCGICGFNWDERDLIKSMTAILHHRGPDQGAVYSGKNVSLGHRRLSIIDLSSAGNQPMFNEDRSMLIIFNGEIYNHRELREELEKYEHRFSSNTDTETILHGYEQWGEEIVTRLNGMFAFCIYDQIKKTLFLARDRLGIKPLYYYFNKQKKEFIFASEIKAILLAGVPRQVNISAAKNYLNLRYVPGEETLFERINKLLPGHTLKFDLQNNYIHLKQFWNLPVPKINNNLSIETAAEQVKDILEDSVRRRLIADVPVGIYLSGGIDSAAITALAAKIKKEEQEAIKTFSVGFDYDEKVDELNQAKKISNHFNTDHHEIIIKENIANILPKLIWHFDMPHGDPVIIPNFKLSELARNKGVKVVLSGEGSDEIFAGYVQYKNFILAQKTKLIPSVIKSTVVEKIPLKILDKFFDYPESMGEKGKEKVVDFINNLNHKEKSYQDLTSILSSKDKKLIFSEHMQQTKVNIPHFQTNRKPLLNQILDYDLKRWLPNYILYINDRMTMANSIEGRVPFLDHRLVEYSTTLPAKYKLNGGITKFVLRKALQGVIPQPEIKKHPFYMPLDKWYQQELKELAVELFDHASVKRRGQFNYYYLKKIWENYPQSKLLYGKQLFTFINFELWQRMFIDNEDLPLNGNIKLNSLL